MERSKKLTLVIQGQLRAFKVCMENLRKTIDIFKQKYDVTILSSIYYNVSHVGWKKKDEVAYIDNMYNCCIMSPEEVNSFFESLGVNVISYNPQIDNFKNSLELQFKRKVSTLTFLKQFEIDVLIYTRPDLYIVSPQKFADNVDLYETFNYRHDVDYVYVFNYNCIKNVNFDEITFEECVEQFKKILVADETIKRDKINTLAVHNCLNYLIDKKLNRITYPSKILSVKNEFCVQIFEEYLKKYNI